MRCHGHYAAALLLILLLLAPLAGCVIAGPEGSHRSDCENRGYTPGTAAYNRCLSDAGGRSILRTVDPRGSLGR